MTAKKEGIVILTAYYNDWIQINIPIKVVKDKSLGNKMLKFIKDENKIMDYYPGTNIIRGQLSDDNGIFKEVAESMLISFEKVPMFEFKENKNELVIGKGTKGKFTGVIYTTNPEIINENIEWESSDNKILRLKIDKTGECKYEAKKREK